MKTFIILFISLLSFTITAQDNRLHDSTEIVLLQDDLNHDKPLLIDAKHNMLLETQSIIRELEGFLVILTILIAGTIIYVVEKQTKQHDKELDKGAK